MTNSRRERALTAARIRLRSPSPRPLLDETRIDEVCETLLELQCDFDELMAYVDEAKCEATELGRVTGEPLADFLRRLRSAQNRNPEASPPSDSPR